MKMTRTTRSVLVVMSLGSSVFTPLWMGPPAYAGPATHTVHNQRAPLSNARAPLSRGVPRITQHHPMPARPQVHIEHAQVPPRPGASAPQLHPHVALPADVKPLVSSALQALPPDQRAAVLAQLRAMPPAQLAREAQTVVAIVRSLPPNQRQPFVNALFGVAPAGAPPANALGSLGAAAPYIAFIEQANRAEINAVLDFARKNPGAFSSLSPAQAQQIGKAIAGGIDPAAYIQANRDISAPLLRGAYDHVWPCPLDKVPCYWP